MKSTLVELPPESHGLVEDSIELVEAKSVDEIAERGQIKDEKVLKRLLLPGQSFGPYQILGFVAAGGMGEVYAAERLMKDGRRLGPVALKVISPEYMNDWAIAERFKREAQISRAIRSPHVTRVYEFGETEGGHAFLAMELLQGEELFERMYLTESFTPKMAAETMLELLAGLRAVHEAGFVHRDIKPENIYFTKREGGGEVVKILDFGIAKRSDQGSDPYLSVVGKLYGTPEYIAPEQGLNPDVDHRADLYSVGIILYELLAQKLPFDGETAYSIILQHQNDTPPPLPESVPEGLKRITFTALEKKAEHRFQTAEAFANAIRGWLDGDDEIIDTGTFEPVRERAQTPPRVLETPVSGLPAASKEDIILGAGIAPPVQIFSKSKSVEMQRPKELIEAHTPSEALDVPLETAAPKSDPRPNPKKRERGPAPGQPAGVSEDAAATREKHEESKAATIFTVIVVLVIVAAAIFAAFY